MLVVVTNTITGRIRRYTRKDGKTSWHPGHVGEGILWEEDTYLSPSASKKQGVYLVQIFLDILEERETWRSRRMQGENPWRTYFQPFMYNKYFKRYVSMDIRKGF